MHDDIFFIGRRFFIEMVRFGVSRIRLHTGQANKTLSGGFCFILWLLQETQGGKF